MRLSMKFGIRLNCMRFLMLNLIWGFNIIISLIPIESRLSCTLYSLLRDDSIFKDKGCSSYIIVSFGIWHMASTKGIVV